MRRIEIRTPLELRAIKMKSYAAWLLFSPLVLMSKPCRQRKRKLAS